jgi:putative FmdB family regulatory protein
MPIFEYHCEMCGTTVERLVDIDDVDIKAIHCEECLKNGKDHLAFKKISKTNFKVNGYNADNGYARK